MLVGSDDLAPQVSSLMHPCPGGGVIPSTSVLPHSMTRPLQLDSLDFIFRILRSRDSWAWPPYSSSRSFRHCRDTPTHFGKSVFEKTPVFLLLFFLLLYSYASSAMGTAQVPTLHLPKFEPN